MTIVAALGLVRFGLYGSCCSLASSRQCIVGNHDCHSGCSTKIFGSNDVLVLQIPRTMLVSYVLELHCAPSKSTHSWHRALLEVPLDCKSFAHFHCWVLFQWP